MGVTKFQIVQPRDGLQRNGLTGIDFDDENRCPAMSELFHTRAFCFLLCASMTIVFTTATEYTELLQITNPVFPGLMIGTYFVFSCADKFMTLILCMMYLQGLFPLQVGLDRLGGSMFCKAQVLTAHLCCRLSSVALDQYCMG
mmetsp:Transcript_26888/g.43286  ORF Transcript_26888/g.43286 Transcript_26888/m.43286 type:complete len:143 (+) Transcript_26888:878-1306(+)